jgi:hypothetical protein
MKSRVKFPVPVLAFLPALSAVLCSAIFYPYLESSATPQPNEFNDRVNEVVNGVTIFTSQDTASSGVFSFDSDAPGVGDTEIDLIKIPLTHTFGDQDEVLRPQIRGVLGSLESKRSIATGAPGSIDDFSRLEVLTAGLSGGFVYRAWRELRITPLVGAAYSHLKRRYDYNNSFSQQNLFPYDREAFNTSVDVMTYSPSVEVDYTFNVGGTTLIPKMRYAHLFNDSVSSKSSAIDVSSDSGMLQTFLDVETPLGYSVYGQALGIHPFIVRTDVFGSAKDARGPNYFHEVGADLTFKDSQRKLLEGFSVGASYIFGDNFTGYRIGVGLLF